MSSRNSASSTRSPRLTPPLRKLPAAAADPAAEEQLPAAAHQYDADVGSEAVPVDVVAAVLIGHGPNCSTSGGAAHGDRSHRAIPAPARRAAATVSPRRPARGCGRAPWPDKGPHRHRRAADRRPPSDPSRAVPARPRRLPPRPSSVRSICAVSANGTAAMDSRMRSASFAASAALASGSRIASSSPPKRAAVSMLRICDSTRWAISLSAMSPARCP